MVHALNLIAAHCLPLAPQTAQVCWCWRPTVPRHSAHFAGRLCDKEMPSHCTATLLLYRISLCKVSKQRCECGHKERLILCRLYCLPARHLCSSPACVFIAASWKRRCSLSTVVCKIVDWADTHAEAGARWSASSGWRGQGVARNSRPLTLRMGARSSVGGAGRKGELQLCKVFRRGRSFGH